MCSKCEEKTKDGWILDSGASVHFTMHKQDFIDFEEIRDSPIVRTASAKNPLRIKGKGTIILHFFIRL